MPIYEYLCDKCNTTVEILHKVEDDLGHLCNQCNRPLVKQVSLTSFRLKGRDWAGAAIKHGKGYYGEGLD